MGLTARKQAASGALTARKQVTSVAVLCDEKETTCKTNN